MISLLYQGGYIRHPNIPDPWVRPQPPVTLILTVHTQGATFFKAVILVPLFYLSGSFLAQGLIII